MHRRFHFEEFTELARKRESCNPLVVIILTLSEREMSNFIKTLIDISALIVFFIKYILEDSEIFGQVKSIERKKKRENSSKLVMNSDTKLKLYFGKFNLHFIISVVILPRLISVSIPAMVLINFSLI